MDKVLICTRHNQLGDNFSDKIMSYESSKRGDTAFKVHLTIALKFIDERKTTPTRNVITKAYSRST